MTVLSPSAVSSGDFAAWSQAHAAWATFFATIAAAAASTFVSVVALSIAYLGPRRARESKIRASIYYIGHALGITFAVGESLRGAKDDHDIFLQEVIDKTQPAFVAIDQFFALGVDEEELIKLALNLHAALSLFRGYILFGISAGKVNAKAVFVRKRFDELDKAYSRMYKKFEELSRLHNAELLGEVKAEETGAGGAPPRTAAAE